MTKQELIKRVAAKSGTGSRKEAAVIVDAVFSELAVYFVEERVRRGSTPRFVYPGFGTFIKKRRESRNGRNPRTGEPITIPSTVTVTFQPGQELKSELNRARSGGPGERRRRAQSPKSRG